MRNLLTVVIMLISANLAQAKEIKVLNLTSENTISLTTKFTGRSTAQVVLQAYKLDSELPKGKPIYLVLNTPGGSVIAGLNMFSLLKALGRPIHTVTVFAASMGFQTVQNLGKRYILPSGVLMSHLASGGMRGTLPGSANEKLRFWTKFITDMDVIAANRTKGKWTLKQYQDRIKTEYWVAGKDAVKDGFADEVVYAKCAYKMIKDGVCPLVFGSVGNYLKATQTAKTGKE